jgi:hypothetical protein
MVTPSSVLCVLTLRFERGLIIAFTSPRCTPTPPTIYFTLPRRRCSALLVAPLEHIGFVSHRLGLLLAAVLLNLISNGVAAAALYALTERVARSRAAARAAALAFALCPGGIFFAAAYSERCGTRERRVRPLAGGRAGHARARQILSVHYCASPFPFRPHRPHPSVRSLQLLCRAELQRDARRGDRRRLRCRGSRTRT